MKRAASPRTRKALSALFFFATFIVNPHSQAALYPFSSHTFTNCTATGNSGPTQTQCRTTYSTTWDETDSNFIVVNGIQKWAVPASGTYSVTAKGAAGSLYTGYSTTGFGASIKGDFQFTQGETLQILVGQRGITNSSNSYGGGAGGGSFVVSGAGTLLIAAGGGGSHGTGGGDGGLPSAVRLYADASLTTTGKAGDTFYETGGAGGTNGNAGGASPSAYNGYPGSGFNQDAPSGGAKKWSNGLLGGDVTTYGVGGFGGGGSGGMYGGSGGGGYSGGGANSRHGPGGGGASYNSGVNKTETLTTTFAQGSVTITLVAIAISDSTTTLSVPALFTYRSASNIIATVSAPGRVTFLVNGKRIAGCVSVPTISSGSISATCSYKPSVRGAVQFSASLTPSDTGAYRASTSEPARSSVTSRDSKR